MKKTVWIIITIVIVGGIIFYFSYNKHNGISKGVVKIGVINPMTGPFAVYGKPVQEGMIMAQNEINNSGGINGSNIQLIFEDDAGNPTKTISSINKLISVDRVSVIIGPLSSGTSLAAAPISEKNKIIQISTLAGSPDLTNAGDYIFRIYPSSIVGAKYTIDKALEIIDPKKVAILIPNNTVGKASAEVYQNECKSKNIEIVAVESYNDGDIDYRNQLIKIKENKADIILCSAYWEDGALILKQMTEMNFFIPVFGEDGWHGEISSIVQSRIINKLYYADILFGNNTGNMKMNNFITNYEKTYQKKATTYAATGYDAVYLIKESIAINGYNNNDIKKYLYSTTFTGATGSIKFDKNGDNIGLNFGIYQLDSVDNAILISK